MKKISEIRMTPKRYLILLLVVFSAAFLTAAVIAAINMSEYKKQADTIEITEPDFTSLKDGEFTGTCNLKMVKAWVRATVENGKVTRIQLVHDDSKGDMAEGLIDLVIEKQTLQLDTVSGATYSSKAILKAVENALNKAQLEPQNTQNIE